MITKSQCTKWKQEKTILRNNWSQRCIHKEAHDNRTTQYVKEIWKKNMQTKHPHKHKTQKEERNTQRKRETEIQAGRLGELDEQVNWFEPVPQSAQRNEATPEWSVTPSPRNFVPIGTTPPRLLGGIFRVVFLWVLRGIFEDVFGGVFAQGSWVLLCRHVGFQIQNR